MLAPEEVRLLGRAAREDRVLDQHSYGRTDGEGGTVRLSLWNHPTDTIYGCAEKLLGGEVYHYHSKIIMKDEKIGGAWTWHQDYGYWYQNGVLFPLLTSAFIAVDRATRENGCLQVIKGPVGPRNPSTKPELTKALGDLYSMRFTACERRPGKVW